MENRNRKDQEHCMVCGKNRTELKEIPWTTTDIDGLWGIKCKDCQEKEVQDKIDSFDPEEIDTDYVDSVICPYCGTKHTDDGDGEDTFYLDGEHEYQCSYCENEFDVVTNVEYNYSTYKKEN